MPEKVEKEWKAYAEVSNNRESIFRGGQNATPKQTSFLILGPGTRAIAKGMQLSGAANMLFTGKN